MSQEDTEVVRCAIAACNDCGRQLAKRFEAVRTYLDRNEAFEAAGLRR
jgi:hypothetical protein